MQRTVHAFLLTASIILATTAAHADNNDETKLRAECGWLERAIQREPDRDDSLMMYMRGMRPKCMALTEGLDRKDGSVQPGTVTSILKELTELQDVVDKDWHAAHPNQADPASAPAGTVATADTGAADKAAADRAATDKAAADKAAADKATADSTPPVDKAAAAKAEKERRAAEKKAADDQRKADAAAAKAEKERIAGEKKAAAQAEKERIAAEASGKARLAADKRAADQADEAQRTADKKAAEEQAATDKKAADDRAAADKKAADERAAADKAEAEQMAADQAAAAQLAKAHAVATPPATAEDKRVSGTWEQLPTKDLGKNVKRTLNLLVHGTKVEGEIFEEVWYPAPSAWIDKSCGGNTTFRMVTTARVNGEVHGRTVELRRDVPRMLACTCSTRCTVEERRRGLDLELSTSGQQLVDDGGIFTRPGAVAVVAGSNGGPTATAEANFDGTWETSPFSAQDRKVVLRVELSKDNGVVHGTLTERSTQALPLQSWSQRFCAGADKFEWVTQWKVDGKASKTGKAALVAREGTNLVCSCPSKCKDPDKRRTLDLEMAPDARSFSDGDHVFEHR